MSLSPLPFSQNKFLWVEPEKGLDNDNLEQSKLPRISVITPSYNQGQFIEETICSVLGQNYPNLEYIIIDGGSTDNTVEIIKKYEPWITYWVSEPDRGQTHALNKGIEKSTGEILAYLNSDDYYLPDTLLTVAAYFQAFPNTDLFHGKCRYVNEKGEKVGEQFGNIQKIEEILDLWHVWWAKRQFVQPEVFWTKRITNQIGLFNEDLNFVMDYEYWSRILRFGAKVSRIDAELSCFRFTTTQKSNQSELVAEELLNVVRPLIWDYSLNLPNKHRLVLQGNWLYQSAFLKEIKNSVEGSDCKLIRWLKLIKIILYHPKILLALDFYQRIHQLFSPLPQHSRSAL
ncbi:MAG: glycosyltransferase [Scytolyngbya sp. HA4215-MV1]|jgi:glycosyltransferase involved in cell wall biosynthesis|nr:glycosyltransferase [Scytolyngbya sp. HA4215-MV1]